MDDESCDCQLRVVRIASDGVYLNGGFENEIRKSNIVHNSCSVMWDLNHKLENGIKIVKQKHLWIDTFSKISNKIYKKTKTSKWVKRMEQFKKQSKMDSLTFLAPKKFHPVSIKFDTFFQICELINCVFNFLCFLADSVDQSCE